MRSSFTAVTGLKLSRSPSIRDEAARRRLMLGAGFVVLAMAGAGLGLITAPERGEADSATGPFSYFPSE